MYEFPSLEGHLSPADAKAQLESLGLGGISAFEPLPDSKHVFTHLIWEMDVHALIADSMPEIPNGQWVTRDELESLPLPTAVKAARQWAMERLK